MDKGSFILYTDTAAVIYALSDEQAGAMLKAIYDYVITGETPLMDAPMYALFLMFKAQIDRDSIKWEETKEKRREAGRLGGIRKAENRAKQTVATDSNTKQTVANGSNAKQTVANQAVSVSDSVSVSVSVLDSSNEESNLQAKPKRFTPPTETEVVEYFKERGSTEEEAKHFIDYYTSNGWKVGGKAPMKDFKAAARNWLSNSFRQNNAPVDRAKLLGKVVDRQEHSGHDILAQRKPFRLKAE